MIRGGNAMSMIRSTCFCFRTFWTHRRFLKTVFPSPPSLSLSLSYILFCWRGLRLTGCTIGRGGLASAAGPPWEGSPSAVGAFSAAAVGRWTRKKTGKWTRERAAGAVTLGRPLCLTQEGRGTGNEALFARRPSGPRART